MIIRPYTKNDRNTCLAIFHGNCPGFFDPSEINGLTTWLDGQDNNQLAYPDSIAERYYILETENKVIGCGGFCYSTGKQGVSMTWGMVDRQYHKKGFGTALLLYRINQIKQLYKDEKIVLDTTQHTYRFFEQAGFRVTKITPDFYGKGLDRYDMVH